MCEKNKGNDMSIFLQANIAQAKALEKLNPEHDCKLEICLCQMFGAEWRCIINEFLERQGKVPNGDDLIWCSSLDEHLGKDIRLIVEEIKKEI